MADFKLSKVWYVGIMETENERRIGLEILKKIRSLNLPLKLDEITEGRGNCFPLAILAQCQRQEIFKDLSNSMQHLIYQNDPTLLRQEIYKFMKTSRHPKINEYKRRYEEIVSVIDQVSWTEYWEVMVKNYEWVDYVFIQSAAWFLSHDIIIVTTTSTESHPFITISGNLNNEKDLCKGPPLIIGSKSQVHYQSLLPLTRQKCEIKPDLPADAIQLKVLGAARSENNSSAQYGLQSTSNTKYKNDFPSDDHNGPNIDSKDEFPDLNPPERNLDLTLGSAIKKSGSQTTSKCNGNKLDSGEYRIENPAESKKMDKKFTFQYENEGKIIDFEFKTDKRVQCPICKIDYKNILRHLQQSACNIQNQEEFREKFQEFKNNTFAEKIQQNQKDWRRKSLAKKRQENSQKVKDDQKRWKEKSRDKQRLEDEKKVKDDQNNWKGNSRGKQRLEDNQKVKNDQNKWKENSMAK